MNKSNYIISEFEIRSFTSSEITMKFNTFRSMYLQRPIYRYSVSSVPRFANKKNVNNRNVTEHFYHCRIFHYREIF